MEIGRLDEQVELLQTVGFTLSVEERFRLRLAHLNLLAAHPDIDQLKFWGRIDGTAKSYYLALGLRFRKSYEFPHKYFFWAYPLPHAAPPPTSTSNPSPNSSSSTRPSARSSTPCPSWATPTGCW